MSDEIIKVFIL